MKKREKLDQWQIEVIDHMKHKDSVIVKAPTSSGKSFVGYSAGVIHKEFFMSLQQHRSHIKLEQISQIWVIKYVIWFILERLII